jgi:tetratricopeptide (TPR) repeat protein
VGEPAFAESLSSITRSGMSTTLASPFSRIARIRRQIYRGDRALRVGNLDRSERHSRKALQLLDEPGHRTDDPELAGSVLELRARLARELGRFTDCAEFHTRTLAVLDGASADMRADQLRIDVLCRLGEALRILARYVDAEDHLRRAVQLARDLQPPDPVVTASALNALGIVYKDTERFDAAEDHYRRALILIRRAPNPDDAMLAVLYHNLAGLHHAQEHFEAGEPLARRALELRAATNDPLSTGVAGDLAVLGALLAGQGRYGEAEHVLRQSLEIWQQRFGPQHFEVAVVQHNLGALHLARGNRGMALYAYRLALDIKRDALGIDHPQVAQLEQEIDRLTQLGIDEHDRRAPPHVSQPSRRNLHGLPSCGPLTDM